MSKKDKNKSNEKDQIGSNEMVKEKGKNKTLKITLSILLIILIILGVILGRYVYKSGSIKGAIISMVKDVVGDQNPIFVLIMGVSEDISSELTDTIMLAGYNPDTNQAFILSIPRDTFIGNNEATAGGYDKINALYQKGPKKTVEAVENLTGIKIDNYITVKNSALVEIVDAIGGVEFNVPIDMNYDDTSQDLHIHLKAGKQLLNGDQAEQLVRFRHNNNGTTYSASYGDNDEGRMRTQREFLKATAQQVITWNNVDKIKEITTAVFSNLETNIELSKLLGYIPYAVEFNTENLSMEQLPGSTRIINELWFFDADDEKIKILINQYSDKLGLTAEERQLYTKEIKKTTKNKTTNATQKNTTKTTTKKNKTNTANNNVQNSNTIKNNVKNNNIDNTNKTTNNANNSTSNNIGNTTNTTKNENVNEIIENNIQNNESTVTPTTIPTQRPTSSNTTDLENKTEKSKNNITNKENESNESKR